MDKKRNVSEAHLSYLKFVIMGQLLLEANDDLALTNIYRQNIKNQVNKLSNMLESSIQKEYDKVYGTDMEMTTNILNKIDELVIKIASSNIDELVMINSIIDKYNDNKDWFIEFGSADFLKID